MSEDVGEGTIGSSPPERLEQSKRNIVELIQRGQHAAAISALEQLAAADNPDAAEYVAWARRTIPEVKALPKKLRQGIPQLLATADRCMKAHDYAQAAQLLQRIPSHLRSDETQKQLNKAIDLQDECDLLFADIQDCVRTQQYEGIEDNLRRFLKLKPAHRFARELWDTLQSYRSVPPAQRAYRFDDGGNLLPKQRGSLWESWLLWSCVTFLVAFGLMAWAMHSYLNHHDQTLTLMVDEVWLSDQDGTLILAVDQAEYPLDESGREIEVPLGDHGFSVRDRDRVIHDVQTLRIVKRTDQVLTIDAAGIRLGVSGVPNPPPDSIGEDAALAFVVDAPRTPLPDGPPELVKELTGLKGPASQIEFSPSGRHIAAVRPNQLVVWNVSFGQVVHERKEPFWSLAFDNSGRFLYVGGKELVKFDTSNWSEALRFESGTGTLISLDVSPDETRIAGHFRGGSGVWIWDASTGKVVQKLPGGSSAFSSAVAFLPDGRLLTSDSERKYGIRLWDVSTGKEIQKFEHDGDPLAHRERRLSVAPDGQSFVIAASAKTSMVADIRTGEVARAYTRASVSHAFNPWFLPDGRHIIRGSQVPDNEIFIVNTATGEDVYQFTADGCTAKILAVAADGRFVASAGGNYWDGKAVDTGEYQIQIWRLPREVWPTLKSDLGAASIDAPHTPLPDGPPGLIGKLEGHSGSIRDLEFAPDGRTVITSSSDRTVRFWNVAEKSEDRRVTLKSAPSYLGVSDTGHVVTSDGNRIHYLDSNSNRVTDISGVDDLGTYVAISPDGQYVACNTSKGRLRIWKKESNNSFRLIQEERTEANQFSGVGFIPGRNELLARVASDEVGLFAWDDSGNNVTRRKNISIGAAYGYSKLAVAPAGDRFLWVNFGRKFVVDIGTGRSISQLDGTLGTATFSPDGKYVIAVGADGAPSVFDSATGKLKHSLAAPRNFSGRRDVDYVSVSPDGRFVATGGGRYWDADEGSVDTKDYAIYLWRLPREVWPAVKSATTAAESNSPRAGLKFDGRGYVEIPGFRYDGSTPLTVEAIVSWDGDDYVRPNHGVVVANNQSGGVALTVRSQRADFVVVDRDPQITYRNAAGRLTDTAQPHHLAGVLDGKSFRLYVDGVLANEETLTHGHRPSRQPLLIGADPDATGAPSFGQAFKGTLFALRITETALYEDNFAPPESFIPSAATACLYDIRDATADTLRDRSGHQRHATIHGAELVPFDAAPAAPVRPSF